MTRKVQDPFAALESGVSRAVEDADGGAKAVVDSVADVLAAALRESAEAFLLDKVPAMAGSAVHGAAKAGGDLGSVARGFLLGVLRESGLTGEPALDAVARAGGAFIERVRDVGGDAAGAARGLVEGAMVWAGELGQDMPLAAAAAGQAAVDAAYDIDAKTGAKVRDALRGGIAGVTIVFKGR